MPVSRFKVGDRVTYFAEYHGESFPGVVTAIEARNKMNRIAVNHSSSPIVLTTRWYDENELTDLGNGLERILKLEERVPR